jgi:chromosome segregation ATPase
MEAKVTQAEALLASTLEEERTTSTKAIEELQLRLMAAVDETKTLKTALENKDGLGVEVTALNTALQDHQFTIDLLSAEKADLSQTVSVLKSQLGTLEAKQTEVGPSFLLFVCELNGVAVGYHHRNIGIEIHNLATLRRGASGGASNYEGLGCIC